MRKQVAKRLHKAAAMGTTAAHKHGASYADTLTRRACNTMKRWYQSIPRPERHAALLRLEAEAEASGGKLFTART